MIKKIRFLICVSFFIVSCGGGGSSISIDNDSGDNNFKLSGSVPGTLIEAFGENGSYYKSTSTDDGTDRHPFSITLKQGVAYYLFMTVNENTPQSITTPIEFTVNGRSSHIFTANSDVAIDLGHISLYTTRSDASGDDTDGNGILDSHHKVEVVVTGLNLLPTPTATTTWDHDNDRIHNKYDDDYSSNNDNDNDNDGVPDSIDVNPNNDENDDNNFPSHLDRDNDGYLDEDRNHDAYYDDDNDRDGYHDDDHDHDGYHDDGNDRDGYHDDDNDRDGYHDDDNHDGYHDDDDDDHDGYHDDDDDDHDGYHDDDDHDD